MAKLSLVLGSVSLVFASVRLFRSALEKGMPLSHLYWIIPVAVMAGAFKARFVMRRRMRANIQRLAEPGARFRPWQIYPPQLLAFILSMVVLMFVLKRAFADSGFGLGCLGGVDFGVAVALAVATLEYGRPGARNPLPAPADQS
jgi:hypothetical protein